MANIQTKINFGNETLETLIDEIIRDKMYKTTNRIKNEKYLSTNIDKKVDETK